MKARLFISTGEVSGDLQGALLVKALKQQATQQGFDLEIVALGGDRMAAAGAQLLGNTMAIGSIGILESLPYVLPTLQIQRDAKQYLRQHPPDLVVLIDYLGPNLNLGNYIKRHLPQVPIIYYIAPQEWVWSLNSRNTQQIVGIIDRLLAIFPGEAQYYKQRGATVTYVGHPLVDRLQHAPSRTQARETLGIPPEQTAIALIPASRRQELKYLLPVICQTAQQLQAKLPQVHFWIPLSLETYRQSLEQAIQHYGLRATLVVKDSQTVIAAADLAIAKSGTVNLEIALANVPQIVLYRVNPLTAWIAKHLLRFSIPFMSPPNLILMEAIVPEFLQDAATPDNITQAALALLTDPAQHQQMLSGYQRMRQAIGEPGVCDRAAQEILSLLTVSSD
ncbi:lipid-A-disaccharide synthase [Oscillatoria sp. FACHB-1407]|uniref:lipid-A-disaccharide synthase n=1 Tax=Oscillatoria sp. FACHB-1407 TaxID=2692847 RepID=UPI00168497FD|nr:lipid-A-disaccharide synthase [Oscillatoria sp. FACHB-1407]MBD2464015.1 lipid-A-disaccharide synthase [Oscillatoria sp. FACHB-1407]